MEGETFPEVSLRTSEVFCLASCVVHAKVERIAGTLPSSRELPLSQSRRAVERQDGASHVPGTAQRDALAFHTACRLAGNVAGNGRRTLVKRGPLRSAETQRRSAVTQLTGHTRLNGLRGARACARSCRPTHVRFLAVWRDYQRLCPRTGVSVLGREPGSEGSQGQNPSLLRQGPEATHRTGRCRPQRHVRPAARTPPCRPAS